MTIDAKRIVDCALNSQAAGLATLALSLLNVFVLHDVGTEVVTLQNYYHSIEDCVSLASEPEVTLHKNINESSVSISLFD